MGRHAARRPCPFCEWVYTDIRTRPLRGGTLVRFVRCCACRACGPEGRTKAEAERGWERARRIALRLAVTAEVVPIGRPTNGS